MDTIEPFSCGLQARRGDVAHVCIANHANGPGHYFVSVERAAGALYYGPATKERRFIRAVVNALTITSLVLMLGFVAYAYMVMGQEA